MLRSLVRVGAALLTGLALAGCGGAQESTDRGPVKDADASGSPITIAGNSALTWGDGPYGVVLAHGAAFDAASWEQQAVVIAGQGASVVAVEDISPEAIQDAVEHLLAEGITEVALVGGSAGADAILDLASREPDLPDQLILLSPNTTVDGLGEEPKLFIASEDEPNAGVATALADSAPGDDNEVTLLPGSAHAQNIFATDKAAEALDAMLERLQRYAAD